MSSMDSNFNDNQTKLSTLLESTKQWKDLSYWDQIYKIDSFMDELGDLFLNYFQTHLDEAKRCELVHAALLEEAIPLINKYLRIQRDSFVNVDAYEDPPWEKACRLRTNLAAFEAMFSKFGERLNDKYFKDYIDDRRGPGGIAPSKIPQNAPKDHWWWFQHLKEGEIS